MERIESEEEFDLDVKRFYIPLEMSIKCPYCQAEIHRDFGDQYLSYPTVNKKEAEGLYCSACDKESQVDIILRVAIEVDTDNIRKL